MVLRDSPRRLRDLLLAGLFALLCMHVPLKAALAISLHTGPHQINYMDTPFAVVAQISTGILIDGHRHTVRRSFHAHHHHPSSTRKARPP